MQELIRIEELHELDDLLRDLGRLERREAKRRRVMVWRAKLIPLTEAACGGFGW